MRHTGRPLGWGGSTERGRRRAGRTREGWNVPDDVPQRGEPCTESDNDCPPTAGRRRVGGAVMRVVAVARYVRVTRKHDDWQPVSAAHAQYSVRWHRR